MEKVLDSRNPADVANATVINADLGAGNRRLVVISGTAIYDWVIDTDETTRGEVRVLLGVYAREIEQASPFVGLASISNDETGFVFAVDSARVDIDPASGELSLYVKSAVMGERSGLNRFAYQVVATVVHVGSYIEGTISWPTSLLRPPSNDPSTVAPHLNVVANHHEIVPASGIFAPTDKLTPVTAGIIHSLTIGKTECKANYRIDSPPMAMSLKVMLAVARTFAPGAAGPVVAGQTGGPEVFTLTPAHPTERVDFGLGAVVIR